MNAQERAEQVMNGGDYQLERRIAEAIEDAERDAWNAAIAAAANAAHNLQDKPNDVYNTACEDVETAIRALTK